MNDVVSNIRVDLDVQDPIRGLRTLQTEVSNFSRAINTANQEAVNQQNRLVASMRNSIDVTGAFSSEIVNVESSISRLGKSIDKGKLSLGEYFKYGAAASGRFGRVFKREHDEIMGVAENRVKRLQTQYIALEKSVGGVTKTLAARPMHLFNADVAIATQRQQLFNKLLSDGSTSLINFGKNTQWAGRQLMVGFSIPLAMAATTAGKAFIDLEKQIISFQKVYGDNNTGESQMAAMTEEVKELSTEFTKWGVAVNDSMDMAAQAAATGLEGNKLIEATTQATRLAVLGEIDRQKALETTITLQTAFGIQTEELGNTINYLNAVENQTLTSLDDLAEAIPIAGGAVAGLGGSVQDLSIALTAMREGGFNANMSANALKSGLASLIVPTKSAKKALAEYGISLENIVESNKGDFLGTITAYAEAIEQLDDLSRTRALEETFGKHRYVQMSALFDNIVKENSQAQRAIELTGQSMSELAADADRELGTIEEAVSTKFLASIERLKVAIAPIGETFLTIATPIVDAVTAIIERFNELPDAFRKPFVVGLAVFGGLVPVVTMLVGLFANFTGQIISVAGKFRSFVQWLREGGNASKYVADAQLDATAASASLEGKTSTLTNKLNVQREAVDALATSYRRYISSMNATTRTNPSFFIPGTRPMRGYNTGGRVPGYGNEDTEPALLTPGEFVMNKAAVARFGPVLEAMNSGAIKLLNKGSRKRGYEVAHMSGLTQQELGGFLGDLVRILGEHADVLDDSVTGLGDAAGQFELFGYQLKENRRNLLRYNDDGSVMTDKKGQPLRYHEADMTKRTFDSFADMVKSLRADFATFTTRQYSGTATAELGGINQLMGRVSGSTKLPLGTAFTATDMVKNAQIIEEAMKTGSEDFVKKIKEDFPKAISEIRREGRLGRSLVKEHGAHQADFIMAAERGKEMLGFERGRSTSTRAFGKDYDSGEAQKKLDSLNNIALRIYERGGKTEKAFTDAITLMRAAPGMVTGGYKELISVFDQKIGRDLSFSGVTTGSVRHGVQLDPASVHNKPSIGGVNPKVSAIRAEYLSDRVKNLQKTSSDITWTKIANDAGEDLTESVVSGVKKSAGINSPSRVFKELGRIFSNSIGLGVKENGSNLVASGASMMDDLESGLLSQTSSGATYAPKRSVAAMRPIESIPQRAMDDLEESFEQTAKKSSRLGSGLFILNNAVGALATVFAIVPGPLQEFAGVAMSATFALDGIFGAGMMLKALFPKLGAEGFKLTGIFGMLKGGFVKMIPHLLKFGPIVAGVGAALGLIGYGIYQAVKKINDHKAAVERMGKAADFSASQLEAAAQTFGFTRLQSGFDAAKTNEAMRISGNSDQELADSVATALKEALSGGDDPVGLKAMSEDLRNATVLGEDQARTFVSRMLYELIAAGMPQEVARQVVGAIAAEAGASQIAIEVIADVSTNINEDGAIKNVQEYLNTTLVKQISDAETAKAKFEELNKELGKYYELMDNTAYADPLSSGMIDPLASLTKEEREEYEQARTAAEAYSETIKNSVVQAVEALSTANQNGKITAEQFNEGMEMLSGIQTPEAAEAYKQVLSASNEEYAETIGKLTDVNGLFEIMRANAAGVNITPLLAQLQQLAQSGLDPNVLLGNREVMDQFSKVSSMTARRDQLVAKQKALENWEKNQKANAPDPEVNAYEERLDRLKAANDEIEIKLIKIDQGAEARFKAEFQRRIGNVGIKINGLRDIQHYAEMLGEQIEDIQRGPLRAAENRIKSIEKSIKALTDEQEKINRQIEIYRQEIEKINEAYERQIAPLRAVSEHHQQIVNALERELDVATRQLEEQIMLLENEQAIIQRNTDLKIKALEAEREAFEERVDAQEKAIDDEREAYNEMVDAQTEGIEKRLDANQRSRELVESQVDAINKQIEALEKVARVNETIANQQKNQLDLAEALTSGDMGAAARAMQEGQQSWARDAQELERQGFENQLVPLQDRIAGIDGNDTRLNANLKAIQDEKAARDKVWEETLKAIRLEREEFQKTYDERHKAASAELNAINERIAKLEYERQVITDTYDLRLLQNNNIIEDKAHEISLLEYQRELETAIWSQKVDNYAPRLRELGNQIYAKEQETKAVHEAQIIPLQEKIDKIQRQKELVEDVISDVNTAIQRDKDQLEQLKNKNDMQIRIDDLLKGQNEKLQEHVNLQQSRPNFSEAERKELNDINDALSLEAKRYDELAKAAITAAQKVKDSNTSIVGSITGYLADQWKKMIDGTVAEINFLIDAINFIHGGIVGFLDWINPAGKKDNRGPLLQRLKPPSSGSGGGGGGRPQLAYARGGILPGFTPVSQGDDQLVNMRSGEGVIVSEALRNNPYEVQRLHALNEAALNGGMGKFYEKEGFARGGIIPNQLQGFRGYDPKFLSSIQAWAAETGRMWSMTGLGGARTYAQQQKLYNDYLAGRGPLAANPAKGGPHMTPAIAMDLSPRPGENAFARGLLAKYGLGLTVRGEPWHVGSLRGRSGLAGIIDMASGAFDAVSGFFADPIGSIKGMISDAGYSPSGSGNVFSRFGPALLDNLAAGAGNILSKLVPDFFGGSGNNAAYRGGGSVERWRPVVEQALGIMRLPKSLAGTTLRRLNQESGGNPNAVNKWDVNWLRGYPSVGLMQVIRGTYAANKHPDHDRGPYMYGVSTDPLSNILASMRYALKRYGSLPAAYDKKGGYSKGGIIEPLFRDLGGPVPPGISLLDNRTSGFEHVFNRGQMQNYINDLVEPIFNVAGIPNANMGVSQINNSGNVYNEYNVSVVANPGDNTEYIANRVVEKIAAMNNNEVRGGSGIKRVSIRQN